MMINSGTVDSLTVSKAAWLLAAFPYSVQWKDINEFNYLTHAVFTGLQGNSKFLIIKNLLYQFNRSTFRSEGAAFGAHFIP